MCTRSVLLYSYFAGITTCLLCSDCCLYILYFVIFFSSVVQNHVRRVHMCVTSPAMLRCVCDKVNFICRAWQTAYGTKPRTIVARRRQQWARQPHRGRESESKMYDYTMYIGAGELWTNRKSWRKNKNVIDGKFSRRPVRLRCVLPDIHMASSSSSSSSSMLKSMRVSVMSSTWKSNVWWISLCLSVSTQRYVLCLDMCQVFEICIVFRQIFSVCVWIAHLPRNISKYDSIVVALMSIWI